MQEAISILKKEFTELIETTIRKVLSEQSISGINIVEPGSDILNLDEACEFLNLKKPTIYSKTSTGSIPHFKQGKKLYFKKSELLKWIESGKKEVTND